MNIFDSHLSLRNYRVTAFGAPTDLFYQPLPLHAPLTHPAGVVAGWQWWCSGEVASPLLPSAVLPALAVLIMDIRSFALIALNNAQSLKREGCGGASYDGLLGRRGRP